jgi:hypothetical protein
MAIYPNDVYAHNVFFTSPEGIPIVIGDAIYTLYRFNDDNTIEKLITNEPMDLLDEDEPSSWTAFITIPSDTAGQTLYIKVEGTNLADERIVKETSINIDAIKGMRISFV